MYRIAPAASLLAAAKAAAQVQPPSAVKAD